MKPYILSAGLYDGRSLEEMQNQAEFRRATRNQIFAYLAIQAVLEPHAARLSTILPRLGLVVGTGHGELAVTKDFLGELGKSGVARPILFQNSLHNATLGFLTKAFSVMGPALTVSNLFFSGENAIDLATVLLESGDVDYCLAVGVDGLVPELAPSLRECYPHGTRLGEGAGALLLSRREISGCQAFLLAELTYGQGTPVPGVDFYDANGIEIIARHQSAGEIVQRKPDGGFSHCRLELA